MELLFDAYSSWSREYCLSFHKYTNECIGSRSVLLSCPITSQLWLIYLEPYLHIPIYSKLAQSPMFIQNPSPSALIICKDFAFTAL